MTRRRAVSRLGDSAASVPGSTRTAQQPGRWRTDSEYVLLRRSARFACLDQALGSFITAFVHVLLEARLSIRRSALVALSAAAVVGSVLAAPGTAVAAVTCPETPNGDVYVEGGTKGTVDLRWTISVPGGMTGLRVLRGANAASLVEVASLDSAERAYRDTGLTPGASYTYAVQAIGGGDEVFDCTTTTIAKSALVYTTWSETESRLMSQGLAADARANAGMPIELTSTDADGSLSGASVSPDGTKVVYESWGSNEDDAPVDLFITKVDGSTAPVKLTSLAGQEIYPSWSADGSKIIFTRYSGLADEIGDLYTVSATGGTPAALPGGAKKSEGVFIPGTSDVIANDDTAWDTIGTSKLTRISGGKSALIGGTTDMRSPAVSPDGKKIAAVKDDYEFEGDHPSFIAVLPIGGGTATQASTFSFFSDTEVKAAFDEQPEWNDSGSVIHFNRFEVAAPLDDEGFPVEAALTEGAALASVPPNGNGQWTGLVYPDYYETSPSVTTPDTLGPIAQMTTPVSLGTSVPSFTLRWKAWDPGFSGVAKYDVKFSRYTTSGSKAEATLATGTTATSRVMNLKGGYYYCFYSRATDKAGNVGAWSAPRCIATALDDKSLGKSKGGWTTNTSSKYYGGSASWTGKKGAYVVRTGVTAKQVGIVVRTCTTCGAVNLYIGSTKIGTLNTKSSSPSFQKTIWLPATKSTLKGNLKIQTTSTARVFIDGIYVRTF
jgi:hypothetical protein